ncbi:thermonuclease family protein [Novosphingobium sp. Leaf2]|uniref:thermonuclease family protein n=1 Tax=Novosphingobium sp. Leaf2 TaxID=1735670 RepID=UPI0006F6FD1E|nr:thermonuclease family protein [Novosphingobium sp. Leaf2]KQM21940.1 hypothetical protein ASE49_01100 [Novosphingobium sp. Leaf2]
MFSSLILLAAASQCVAYVHDGDTLKRCDGQRLRLALIDAPEVAGSPSCQPRKRTTHWCDNAKGQAAKAALQRFMASGPVTIKYIGQQDFYGRPLVKVIVDGKDAGDYLIARGLARRWAR